MFSESRLFEGRVPTIVLLSMCESLHENYANLQKNPFCTILLPELNKVSKGFTFSWLRTKKKKQKNKTFTKACVIKQQKQHQLFLESGLHGNHFVGHDRLYSLMDLHYYSFNTVRQ